jgi:hypothetical protein
MHLNVAQHLVDVRVNRAGQFVGFNPNVCGVASGAGIALQGYCFDAPFPSAPDGISDGGGNVFDRNEADPNGSCPTVFSR